MARDATHAGTGDYPRAGSGMARSARADGLILQHTIPREVDAYDFTTGGPFMAPPVPYGHYAKDYVGGAQKAMGCVTCKLHGLMGGGGHGHSLFHNGDGADGGCGHGESGCSGGADRVRLGPWTVRTSRQFVFRYRRRH